MIQHLDKQDPALRLTMCWLAENLKDTIDEAVMEVLDRKYVDTSHVTIEEYERIAESVIWELVEFLAHTRLDPHTILGYHQINDDYAAAWFNVHVENDTFFIRDTIEMEKAAD